MDWMGPLATLLSGAIVVGAAHVSSRSNGRRNAAAFGAALNTRVEEGFKAIHDRIDSRDEHHQQQFEVIREEQQNQWTKINDAHEKCGVLGERVARMEGRMNGHRAGAGAD